MPEQLSKHTQSLFLLFKEAVEKEREAQVMYRRAAGLSDDVCLKRLFEDFCQDEAQHEQVLLEQYSLLRREYGLDAIEFRNAQAGHSNESDVVGSVGIDGQKMRESGALGIDTHSAAGELRHTF